MNGLENGALYTAWSPEQFCTISCPVEGALLNKIVPLILKFPVVPEQLDNVVVIEDIEHGLTILQFVVEFPELVKVISQATLS